MEHDGQTKNQVTHISHNKKALKDYLCTYVLITIFIESCYLFVFVRLAPKYLLHLKKKVIFQALEALLFSQKKFNATLKTISYLLLYNMKQM